MKLESGKTVLITGGASGIGRIMVRRLLELGTKVIVWDIDAGGIEEIEQKFRNKGMLYTFCVDISDLSEIQRAASAVKSEHGSIDVLINNAGIVVGGYFQDHSAAAIGKTMEVNANAPMYITKAFLNDMLERNSGHICNIASSAGLISNPKMAVYVASKWALTGWSDSLRLEMIRQNKNIGVTTIMPYFIDTGMFEGVKSRIPGLEPEKVAKIILHAIEKNRNRLTIPGYLYRLARLGQGLMSVRFFDWFADKVMGIYTSMDHFTGRK